MLDLSIGSDAAPFRAFQVQQGYLIVAGIIADSIYANMDWLHIKTP